MTRLEAEIESFRGSRGPYKWRDFVWLLEQLGYELHKRVGKTGGARRRYVNKKTGHIIFADEPHDGEMRKGMVKRLQRDLEGVI